MKKILLLLALTITLQNGTQHVYENAEVWESTTFRSEYIQGSSMLPTDFWDHWMVDRFDKIINSSWKMEQEVQYLTVHDKENPSKLLGIYEKSDVIGVETK